MKNESLQDLMTMLLAQHQALVDKLNVETDPDMAQAILTEMQEMLHRIDLTQNLLFREVTKTLEASVAKVTAANDDLTDALKSATNAAALVKGVTAFLTLVDKAIDIAKTLAVA